MKASEIKQDAMLYWDPSTKWMEGRHDDGMTKVKVVDPTPRHWKWDFQKHCYSDNGRPSLMGTYGIMVEIQEGTHSHYTFDPPRIKIATLNSLRGPYERVVARVAETRDARLSAAREQAEGNQMRNDRIMSVGASAEQLGVVVTAIYPFTVVQVPIAEFEAMVAVLVADGWRYEPA